jgi:hypothetical protein
MVKPAVVTQNVTVQIHFQQRGRGDLVKHLAVTIDQKMVRLVRDTHRHVRVDRVGPVEVIANVIERGEIAAGLPLGLGHVASGRHLYGG